MSDHDDDLTDVERDEPARYATDAYVGAKRREILDDNLEERRLALVSTITDTYIERSSATWVAPHERSWR